MVKIVIKTLYITTIVGIQVSNLLIQSSVTDIDNFLRNIDPCGPSDSFGIDIDKQSLNYISAFDLLFCMFSNLTSLKLYNIVSGVLVN